MEHKELIPREVAIEKLKALVRTDISPHAEKYGVTIWDNGKLNKGWFGQVVEGELGLPRNSLRAPDFGTWELKTTSLRISRGRIVPKETIAVTMIKKADVIQRGFYESHLYEKLEKMVILARLVTGAWDDTGLVYSVKEFDLKDKELLEGIKQDYDLVRETLLAHGPPEDDDLSCLTGKMGKYVQPRTKGPGHGSTSRAFYMRTGLVARILGL